MRHSFAAIFPWLLLAGCAVQPEAGPQPKMPPAWREPVGESTTTAIDAQSWWAGFGDPELTELLARAERDSPDLQMAVARLRAAGDAVTVARAQRLPTLTFLAGPLDVNPAVTQAVRSISPTARQPFYELGLQVHYELDLWGRLENGVKADDAARAASAYDLAAARIALRSAVATAWFELRQTDAAIALETQRVPLANERLRLLDLRIAAGRADQNARTEAQLAADAAAGGLIALQRSRRSLCDALAVLIGTPPQGFDLPPTPLALDGPQPPVPPAGLPATLLERRPDLRAADARLSEAEARTAAARAQRLPQVGLTALLGLASGPLRNVLGDPRGFFGAGPNIDAPIFDGGALDAQASAAGHLAEVEVASYRKTALAALAEVERALRDQQSAIEDASRAESAVQQLDAQRQRLQLQLDAGRITRFELIDLESRQLDAEAADLRAQRARQDAAVALYQALGGGWSASDVQPEASQANR